jgi:pantoate--beta-alanine ligase
VAPRRRAYCIGERAGFDASQQAGFKPDYFSIRDAATLDDPRNGEEVIILTAARNGRARLIDNLRAMPR